MQTPRDLKNQFQLLIPLSASLAIHILACTLLYLTQSQDLPPHLNPQPVRFIVLKPAHDSTKKKLPYSIPSNKRHTRNSKQTHSLSSSNAALPPSLEKVSSKKPEESPPEESTESLDENSSLSTGENGTTYLTILRQRVQKSLIYPLSLRRRSVQGRVKVQILLQSDGSVSSIKIQKSSGHPELDQLALQAIARAAPFPLGPHLLTSTPLNLFLPIDFILQ